MSPPASPVPTPTFESTGVRNGGNVVTVPGAAGRLLRRGQPAPSPHLRPHRRKVGRREQRTCKGEHLGLLDMDVLAVQLPQSCKDRAEFSGPLGRQGPITQPRLQQAINLRVEPIRLLVFAFEPRDRSTFLALRLCSGSEPREQRLLLVGGVLPGGLGEIPLCVADRVCRKGMERSIGVLTDRALQQFKEHLDPAVAVRKQPDGFIEVVVGGAAEDVHRGAHAEYYHSMSHDGSEEPLPPTPPLKRHATLQPLSREHMGGLIQARSLRQAADRERAKRLLAIASFLDAWRSEIRAHFDDEERLLLPLVSSPVLRERLLDEHGILRRLAEECERDPEAAANDTDLLRQIGVRLHDHIRWEEREFFEAVQRDHPEALAALASEASSIEEQRPGSRARYRLSVDDHDAGRNEAEL